MPANAFADSREYFYRRIPNILNYVKRELPIPIQPAAFHPRKPNARIPGDKGDYDGISVYRARKISARRVAKRGTNENGYYVARIKLEEFQKLGLHVVPDETHDDIPGHSLIPDMNCNYSPLDKRQTRSLQVALAKIASRNLVFEPGDTLSVKTRNLWNGFFLFFGRRLHIR